MNRSGTLQASNILKTAILVSIVAVCFVVARSGSLLASHPQIVYGVTLDLTVTLPLAYLFFIRKTRISKLTAVPLFIFGVIFASFILPAGNHRLLDLIKFVALPFVELGIFGYAGFVVYKSRKTYKTLDARGADFMENLRETLAKEFPAALANAAAFEIAGFYYAFIAWKTSRGERFFSYHKRSGAIAVLIVIGFLAAIEAVVFHILLHEWSRPAAWVLTALSAYFVFQIFAHGKAILIRPTEIAGGKILLRCGLLGDAAIEIEAIEKVELTTENFEPQNGFVKLASVGKLTAHNVKIVLRDAAVLNGIYGIKKEFKTIFLAIDEAERFKETIESGFGK